MKVSIIKRIGRALGLLVGALGVLGATAIVFCLTAALFQQALWGIGFFPTLLEAGCFAAVALRVPALWAQAARAKPAQTLNQTVHRHVRPEDRAGMGPRNVKVRQ